MAGKAFRQKNDTNSPIFWERFWAKVQKTQSCWLWLGARDQNGRGYGHIRLPGHGRLETAHRLAYANEHGPIPFKALVLHSCHNKICVNPSHLRLGNYQANANDRARRSLDQVYKLDWQRVLEIRRFSVLGALPRELARSFSVSTRQIQYIIAGRIWGEGVLG